MKHNLMALGAVLLILSGCGGSPTAPATPSRPPALSEPIATLSVTVMSNRTGQPIAGMSVALIRPTGQYPSDDRVTGADGRASWTVEAATINRESAHVVIVDHQYRMTGHIVADAGWLISLP